MTLQHKVHEPQLRSSTIAAWWRAPPQNQADAAAQAVTLRT
jgi:hypothetical protein